MGALGSGAVLQAQAASPAGPGQGQELTSTGGSGGKVDELTVETDAMVLVEAQAGTGAVVVGAVAEAPLPVKSYPLELRVFLVLELW